MYVSVNFQEATIQQESYEEGGITFWSTIVCHFKNHIATDVNRWNKILQRFICAKPRTLKKNKNISSAIKPHTTIRKLLVHPKGQNSIPSKHLHCNYVYEIPCGGCNLTYVGEKKRTLGTRLEEHCREADKPVNISTPEQKGRNQKAIWWTLPSQTMLPGLIM